MSCGVLQVLMTGPAFKRLRNHWARSVSDKPVAVQLLKVQPFIYAACRLSCLSDSIIEQAEQPYAIATSSYSQGGDDDTRIYDGSVWTNVRISDSPKCLQFQCSNRFRFRDGCFWLIQLTDYYIDRVSAKEFLIILNSFSSICEFHVEKSVFEKMPNIGAVFRFDSPISSSDTRFVQPAGFSHSPTSTNLNVPTGSVQSICTIPSEIPEIPGAYAVAPPLAVDEPLSDVRLPLFEAEIKSKPLSLNNASASSGTVACENPESRHLSSLEHELTENLPQEVEGKCATVDFGCQVSLPYESALVENSDSSEYASLDEQSRVRSLIQTTIRNSLKSLFSGLPKRFWSRKSAQPKIDPPALQRSCSCAQPRPPTDAASLGRVGGSIHWPTLLLPSDTDYSGLSNTSLYRDLCNPSSSKFVTHCRICKASKHGSPNPDCR
ncbi:unnamed protein product [Calicophoron daubneyi]|uniref:Uncharacterized protein n=1 Tax=Calicophoron daubneyi TaxID=300641 RepID=A0AAV2TS38_CALDB